MSLKDEILAKYAPKPEKVVGLNGLDVYAKALSAADWFDLRGCETQTDRFLLSVIRGACDAAGERVFSDEDMPRVRLLPSEFCTPVSNAVLALSGFSTEDVEGKADSTPEGASPSG